MEIVLRNGKIVTFRPYKESDFKAIQSLNHLQEWDNLVEKDSDTKNAWRKSNITFVAILDDALVGYIRGLTDGNVTTYICELLVSKDCQGLGIGKQLLKFAHSLYPNTKIDLLASSTSESFYSQNDFRPFYGYRKNIEE